MKWNTTGHYHETSTEHVLQDPETGRLIIFCMKSDSKLIVRSMFEEDINPVLLQHNQSSSKKRQIKRAMGKDLTVNGSEMAYFVVERLTTDVIETEYDAEHDLVSYKSKIIGFAARKDSDFHLCLNVLEKNSDKALVGMFTEIRDVLELKDGLLYLACY